MKKLLIVLAVLLFSNSAMAYEVDTTKQGEFQRKIQEIGFKILNANRIEKRIVFNYRKSNSVNAYAYYNNHSVTILSGIITYMDDDAELAGVISHEISHNMDYYSGCWNGYFTSLAMTFTPQKYEKKADKKAIDLMVKAGYNPVACIIAMNKISGNINWWIWSGFTQAHPLTSERLAYMYEYIYTKYPAYLVDNEYKENAYYQNFLLTSKKAREKIRKNYEINVSNTKKL